MSVCVERLRRDEFLQAAMRVRGQSVGQADGARKKKKSAVEIAFWYTSCTEIKIIIRFYFIVCERFIRVATIRDTLLLLFCSVVAAAAHTHDDVDCGNGNAVEHRFNARARVKVRVRT